MTIGTLVSTLYATNESLTALCAQQNRIIQQQNETLARLGEEAAEEERASCAQRLMELVGEDGTEGGESV